MKKASKKRIVFVFMGFLIAILCVSTAMADFYVISGGRGRRTILVSPKSTAELSGTALQNAISGITDASSSNRYLVIIEPGTYTLSSKLSMKNYVSVTGSGPKSTIIQGAFSGTYSYSSSSIAVETADHMTLSNLQIKNTGGPNPYSVGVYLYEGDDVALQNVTIDVVGNSVYGVYNDETDRVRIEHCEIKTDASDHARGINNAGDTEIIDSDVVADSATSTSNEAGIYTSTSGTTVVRRSTIQSIENGGGGFVLRTATGGTVSASQSTLIGSGEAGTNSCIYCDDGSGAGFACD